MLENPCFQCQDPYKRGKSYRQQTSGTIDNLSESARVTPRPVIELNGWWSRSFLRVDSDFVAWTVPPQAVATDTSLPWASLAMMKRPLLPFEHSLIRGHHYVYYFDRGYHLTPIYVLAKDFAR